MVCSELGRHDIAQVYPCLSCMGGRVLAYLQRQKHSVDVALSVLRHWQHSRPLWSISRFLRVPGVGSAASNCRIASPCMQVPKDAWMMDMVFSDTGDAHGGFYDSNNGLDYHVPVAGGTASPSPLRVVHVSVEMAPIAKVMPKT